MKKQNYEDNQAINVHVRFSPKDVNILDCCAKNHGISRSAYVRAVVLAHIANELAEMSISSTEKIIRNTLENILDVKTKREAQTLRNLVGEIQRANFMQLKSYMEQHPALDPSEYKAYYYQSKQEAFEVSSGRKSFSSILPTPEQASEDTQPDWLKILTSDDDEEG